MTAPFRSIAWLLLAAVLATGCDRRQPATEFHTAATASWSTPVDAPNDRTSAPLLAAIRFLVDRQSPDGAWRSDVYGTFRQGDALTGLVTSTLVNCSDLCGGHAGDTAVERATTYLAALVGDDDAIAPPPDLAYPVYAAATAIVALSSRHDAASRAAREAWVRYLRGRQLAEPLGWHADDARHGGWSYAAEPPIKPPAGQPLGMLAEPNLSATAFAVAALRAAGMPPDDPAIRKALSFVLRCQNFSDEASRHDGRFDDGGFYFMLGDDVRNKAGVAGTDQFGRVRFASYGSATADGLRVLVLAGVPAGDPRAKAAWAWMTLNFSAGRHPGDYAPDRQSAQPAVYFYYCNALADVLVSATAESIDPALRVASAGAIVDALLARQHPDGSWSNAAVDVREDDPLVATSLAASALAHCRQILP